MKVFIEVVVVRRDVHGLVSMRITHDELMFQSIDIKLVDEPNKKKTLQLAQWNKET